MSPTEHDATLRKAGWVDQTTENVEVSHFGSITFAKISDISPAALLGKLQRSPITGKIRLRGVNSFPDYALVDLYTRSALAGQIGQYVADEYLFRPVPLMYRTWIYHAYFNNQVTTESSSETAMLEKVLSEWCIDVALTAGRESPIMCAAPMALATTLTGDWILVVPAILLVAILSFLAVFVNEPARYMYGRLISLPLRLALFVVILWRLGGSNAAAIVGSVVAILIFVYDFAAGDLIQLLSYKYLCSYRVLAQLPNRVLVCQRHGAAHLEDMFGDRGSISETISGMGAWERNFTLIADIHGLLVELRPMSPADWQRLRILMDTTRPNLQYVGLNVYCDELPTARARAGERAPVKPASTLGISDDDVKRRNMPMLITQSIPADVVMTNF